MTYQFIAELRQSIRSARCARFTRFCGDPNHSG